MEYSGVFVDDQDDVYAETLSSGKMLRLDFLGVSQVTDLARQILDRKPSIVALDYRLDEVPGALSNSETFKGSALAQHLRDECIENPDSDFAIVLVSAEQKIQALYRPDKTAHDLFDRVYVKETINTRRCQIRSELVSLCAGYEKLKSLNGKYDIRTVLAAEDIDEPFVDSQDLRLRFSEASAPHLVAKTVLSLLIDRPGPLIDAADACAQLGVAVKFKEEIESLLTKSGCAYTGLFHEGWTRFWSHRVAEFAVAIFASRATGIPSKQRTIILNERLGTAFEPAASPWNGSDEELSAFACACCRRGTELRHSVGSFEVNLPKFATRRRICWDCVQTDKYETLQPPLLIDDIDAQLAEQVKKQKR